MADNSISSHKQSKRKNHITHPFIKTESVHVKCIILKAVLISSDLLSTFSKQGIL